MHQRSAGLPRLLAGILLIALAPGAAAAAEPQPGADTDNAATADSSETAPTPAARRLGEVVVTASRTEALGFDEPYTLFIVDDETIADRLYRTPTDALRYTPGVLPQKTGPGQGSPFIRGFTGYHVLHLVDGVRLNNSTFRSGPNQYWNTVDTPAIRRIEVVQGPAGVMYGSDAVGGVLNALTKGPQGYGEGFQSGGVLSYRLSSAERSQVGRAEGWATWDHTLGIYVGGSVKKFGDTQGGRSVGRQDNTDYDEWDGDLKIEYFLRPDTRLVLGRQTVRQTNVPRTHRTIYSTTWRGLTRGTELSHDLDQSRDLTYVQLHSENRGGAVDALHAGVSWHEQDEYRSRWRTRGRYDSEGVDVGTVGAFLTLESPSPVGRLVYGVEHYHDNVNSFSSRNLIQGPVADDASYDLTGVFLQDTIPVCREFDLILGGRYEHAEARAASVMDSVTGNRFRLHDAWDSVVGSARGVWHVDKAGHWNVFGGVSQGFRAPNLSDLTRFDIARTGEQEVPSPDLDPERFLSYEAGVKAEYETLALQLAYFYTDIQDLITRVPTGRLIGPNREVIKRNVGRGFVQGVELGGRWRFLPQWTAFGAFTWMDGEADTYPTAAPVARREPVSRLMPVTTEAGVRWEDRRGKLWAEVAGTFVTRQDDLATSDRLDTSRIPPGGTPGYTTLAVRTGCRVTNNVDLTFAIENVTDADYRVHGSGLNEPGRNFLFGVEMRF
jgi:hemoglobin/transferrin/lactoferrin receptor protein